MPGRKFPGKVFVSVDEVKDSLGDYLVFDVRYNLKIKDYGKIEYAKGHLPHAVPVDLDAELCAPLTNSARHPLPTPEHFVQWCKSRGISPERPVLCYDDECGAMGAGRLWWMLDALGVEAYILNGGFQAYEAASLPLETEVSAPPTPVADWPFGVEFTRHVGVRELPSNAVMIDARAPERFNSTVRPYGADALPGHIEGAVNIAYPCHLREENGVKTLRECDEIRETFLRALRPAERDGEPDVSQCIFYCGSGISACINLALVRHLGLGEPLFYCGSWSEYAGEYRVPISRRIVDEHGVWLEMRGPARADQPHATAEHPQLKVDGTVVGPALDPAVKAAVERLHLGEKAVAHLKGGRSVEIEIPIGESE